MFYNTRGILMSIAESGPCVTCFESRLEPSCKIFLTAQSYTPTPTSRKNKVEVTIRTEHSTMCECVTKVLEEKTVTFETFERAVKMSQDGDCDQKRSFKLFTKHILGLAEIYSGDSYTYLIDSTKSNCTIILKIKGDLSAIATGKEEVTIRVDHSLNCGCEKEKLGEKTITLETLERALNVSADGLVDGKFDDKSFAVFTRHVLGLEATDPVVYLYRQSDKMTIGDILRAALP